MKYLLSCLCLLFAFSACVKVKVKDQQVDKKEFTSTLEEVDSMVSNSNDSTETVAPGLFDEAKAKALGADDYGMKKYVIAFLKKGPNRDLDSLAAAKLQAAHMENIGRMAEEGQLVLAGPFLDGGELRGIYIFNVETLQQAEALTHTDPAIEAGSLVMELKEWYGSAALMEVNEIHKTLQKVSF